MCHLKTLHAQEEITQLNIEIKRLATWIVDEGTACDHAIQESQIILNAIVCAFMAQCRWLNDNLQHKLWCLYALPGYTGACVIGEHQEGHAREKVDETEEYLDEEDNVIVDDIFEGVVRLAGQE